MRDLLFLAHRFPYPPNKGDKLRSFHLLRHLASSYRVHLGCFVDDPADWAHVNEVKRYCSETYFAELSPTPARVRSLGSLLRGEPLTLGYYRDKGMSRWVDEMISLGSIHHVLAFSSAMAQYVPKQGPFVRVADMVDVDSVKWGQLASRVAWPLSWIYRRESRTLLKFETDVARSFEATVFVSEAEEKLFRKLAGIREKRVCHAANGVDTDYFSPDLSFLNPFPSDVRSIVFTGAMDYSPNVEAVTWFAREVFPTLRSHWPNVIFVIVGARPAVDVCKLAKNDGITVTGTVDDVRPYLAHADAVVAPLQVARGIQNKVLEGMAMAKTVIASPGAAEGIQAIVGRELLVASQPGEYVDVIDAVFNKRLDLGRFARRRILECYSWEKNLQTIASLLQGAGGSLTDIETGCGAQAAHR